MIIALFVQLLAHLNLSFLPIQVYLKVAFRSDLPPAKPVYSRDGACHRKAVVPGNRFLLLLL